MTATDYTQLHHFLTRKDWKDADIETRQLMLQIAGADSRQDRLLTANDIQNFPCSELKTIDRLWVKASRGRFGFSAISNLYQAVDEDYFVWQIEWVGVVKKIGSITIKLIILLMLLLGIYR
jgi:hypothetical protein